MAKKKSTTKKTDEESNDNIMTGEMYIEKMEVKTELEETSEKAEEKAELEKGEIKEDFPKKEEFPTEEKVKEQEIPLEQYCAGLNQEGIDKFAFERLNSKIAEKLLPVGPHTRTKWETLYLSIRNN